MKEFINRVFIFGVFTMFMIGIANAIDVTDCQELN